MTVMELRWALAMLTMSLCTTGVVSAQALDGVGVAVAAVMGFLFNARSSRALGRVTKP